MNAKRDVQAHPGDVVVVHGHSTGDPGRTGVILEVLDRPPRTSTIESSGTKNTRHSSGPARMRVPGPAPGVDSRRRSVASSRSSVPRSVARLLSIGNARTQDPCAP